jgi:murein DD-endopeptidase MepM/ murein hydrolase activator NlpD
LPVTHSKEHGGALNTSIFAPECESRRTVSHFDKKRDRIVDLRLMTALKQGLKSVSFACAALGLGMMAVQPATAKEEEAPSPVIIIAPATPADTGGAGGPFVDAKTRIAALGGGDSQYRSAFSTWSEMDRGEAAVSIPTLKPIENMRLSSDFGTRSDPFSGRRARHNGIDIPAPRGTPIYATADGVVGRAKWVSGYGNYVEIEHGANIQTRYGHMSGYAVVSGQKVKKGDIVGYVGSTGRSTGNHLHYEVRINGIPVNPMAFVQTPEMLVALRSGTSVSPVAPTAPGTAQGGPAAK